MTYNQVEYFPINHLAGEFWGIKYHTYINKYFEGNRFYVYQGSWNSDNNKCAAQ